MTLDEVMKELESYGNEGTKKVLLKHGAKEPFFGVKVGDMKKIQKKVKKDHELSLALYDTGNGDAMYFAGLIADKDKITKTILKKWAKNAHWYMISEYTVPWIAADSNQGWDLGLEWIKSKKENLASCGWATLSSVLSITPDEEIDKATIKALLKEISNSIHSQENRVRYTMNGFVIAVGSFVPELSDEAMKIARKIGKVDVEMGGTACKVPLATEYIQKVVDKGRLGKKKKMARC